VKGLAIFAGRPQQKAAAMIVTAALLRLCRHPGKRSQQRMSAIMGTQNPK